MRYDRVALSGAAWTTPDEWRAVNVRMGAFVARNRAALSSAMAFARALARSLEALAVSMDRLCAVTCPFCPDLCCRRATVWFDRADIILLHLAGHALPAAQVWRGQDGACGYLGTRGCRLPRASRPFICTWYLCSAQMLRLRRDGLIALPSRIAAAKGLRRRMVDAMRCVQDSERRVAATARL